MRALLKFGKGRYINTSKNQIDPRMDFPCVFEIFTLRVTVASRQFVGLILKSGNL